MASIQDIRKKYPQYSDLTDRELAEKFHAKFYSDMPFEEFSTKINLQEPSYAETAAGVVTDIPTTVANIPGSAANLVGGIYEAVTNPIETVTALGDIGVGGIRNAAILAERNGALPQGSVDFLDSLGDPATAEAASERAAAFGGVIADRWGSAEKIRRTLREDPVGFLGDLSTILTGAGAVTRTTTMLPRVANTLERTAAAVDPLTLAGKGVGAAGGAANKLMPAQTGQIKQTAQNLFPKVVQQLETTTRRAMAGPKARALADITEGEDVNKLIAALEQPSQFPRTTAEAAASTKAAPYVAMQQQLFKKYGETAGFKKAEKTKAAIEAPVANIRGTPAQREAAVKRRQAMSDPFYQAADASFIREDAALRELLGRPEVAAAASRAAKTARSEQRPAVVGETRAASTQRTVAGVDENFRPIYQDVTTPATTAEYSGKYISDIIQDLKDNYIRNPVTAEDKNANRVLRDTVDDLEDWFQSKSQARRAAKDLFKMYSAPVNRSDIGELIFDTLSPTTKRGTTKLDFDAFARLLEDQPAAVTKALKWPTNMDFKKAGFTDADIKAIKAIDAERINKNLTEDLEKFGRAKSQGAIKEIYDTVKGPNFLSVFWTLFNTIMRSVGATIGDKAIAKLALEALDPKLAAKALREMQKKLPPVPTRQMPGMPQAPQRVRGAVRVARAVGAGAKELPRPSKPQLTAAGTIANTMAQAREDYPNAFLTDARGRQYDAQGNRLR